MPLPKKVAGFTQVGKFYTTKAPTDAKEVKELVDALIKATLEKKQLIYILSGTHGTSQGELVRERKFFWEEDKGIETQTVKAVDVWGFTKTDVINKVRWNYYLGRKGIIVLAWCYSEQSRTGWMKKEELSV